MTSRTPSKENSEASYGGLRDNHPNSLMKTKRIRRLRGFQEKLEEKEEKRLKIEEMR